MHSIFKEYFTCCRSFCFRYELLFVILLLCEVLLTSRVTPPKISDRGPIYIKKQHGQFFDPRRKQETDAVVTGYHTAIQECRSIFKWDRWNCTLPRMLTEAKRPVSLSKALPRANKETAYLYAMVAASVTYSLMRSCASGENNRCPCVPERTRNNKTRTTCKQNLEYAFKRAKRVLRSLEVKQVANQERKSFNTKNLRTGIKTIEKELPEVCNCHGISGTCQHKSCWKSIPNIKKVSERLRRLYDKAEKVRYDKATKSLKKMSLKNHRKRSIEIVYIEKSPDYCQSNILTGHKGTLLRYCDTNNPKNCYDLCEACGYRTVKRIVYEQNCEKCLAQFTWCCNVYCRSCHVTKAQCMLRS